MNGLEKIVDYIRADTNTRCLEVDSASASECLAISDEYSKREQEQYWKVINKGTKEAEARIESLGELALKESKKQLIAMRQEMLVEAFSSASDKLNTLSDAEFSALLERVGAPPDTSADALIAFNMERLSRAILSILFD